MEYLRAQILRVLLKHFGPDDRRIEHALRVLYHSEQTMKKHEDYDIEIVVASALLHDVGIKVSEEKHGYNNGKTQEKYGPAIAEQLLSSLDFPAEKIEKVKHIIGNHHSNSRYDYVELEILKEADLIVNRDEDV